MLFEIFDTHAHYDDEVFDLDREKVLNAQFDFGVKKILNCGVDIPSCKKTLDLVNNYDFLYGACGIHPSYAEEYYNKKSYINDLDEYHKNNKILAVGEIGLDYFYKDLDVSIQKEVFKSQLDFAKQINKPVIIHCRDAHFDTFNIVKEFMPISGVVHCFSGSLEISKEWMKLGFYLGIGGVVTFKNSVKLVEVVKNAPIEYLITETDCPYLSPVPFRGKRNQSVNIQHVIQKISEIKNQDFYKIACGLYENAFKFLNL